LTAISSAEAASARGNRPSREYWACQALGWGAYLAIAYFQTHQPPGYFNAGDGDTLFAACLGFALTHGLRYIILERGWLSLELRALVPRAVAAPVVLAIMFQAPLTATERWMLGPRPPSPVLATVVALLRWTSHFAVWEGLYLGMQLGRARHRAETQRRELATALQAAQLRALESQLNPHFLFNALNTVRALIAEDPRRAQDAVTQVASILRHALRSGHDDLVTFESEMAVVEDYLAIEALRLGERLRIERAIAPEAGGARIPAMLLQTLIENAVKHGIAELREGGTLRVCAHVEGTAMLLTVDNPRPSDEERTHSMEASNGIGLANATERLRLLYGDAARLEMDLSRPRHATARVRIPLAR
jgi:hypothetical protein